MLGIPAQPETADRSRTPVPAETDAAEIVQAAKFTSTAADSGAGLGGVR